MSSDLKTLVFGILSTDLLLFISVIGLDLAAIARYLRHRPYKIPRQRIVDLLNTDGPFLAEAYKDFKLYDGLRSSGAIGEVIGPFPFLFGSLFFAIIGFFSFPLLSFVGLIWIVNTALVTYVLYRTWRFARAISKLP